MENDIEEIKKRGALSAGSLFFQSSFSAALGFAAFFILTIKSGMYLLGVYNTVLAMMSFFNYFTDLGLGAAIIQKPKLEEIDLSTVFIIQFVLSIVTMVAGYFLTGYLFKFYKDLPHSAVYLYWSILFSFFFLSMKTVPSVLLEKKIKIYKVVTVQLIENIIFYLCVIVFSLLGYDIYSLIIAVIAQSIVGTVMIYFMQPWMPKFKFSWKSAKALLSFGIPFQGNSFLSFLKDDLLIIYLGGAIGFKDLGIVVFAKKYAEFSIRLISDNLNRVAFPIFSNFQKQKDWLKKSIEKILFYENFMIFPAIVGAMFVFGAVLKVIPGYYDKWHLALFSFYFFSLSALFVSIYSPFINLFNAVGKIKTTLLFMIVWIALTWILVPPSIVVMGYNGVSLAFFIMSLTFIFVLIQAKKSAEFSLSAAYKEPALATLAMTLFIGIAYFVFNKIIVNNYLYLISAIVGGAGVYLLAIYLQKGKGFVSELVGLLRFKKL